MKIGVAISVYLPLIATLVLHWPPRMAWWGLLGAALGFFISFFTLLDKLSPKKSPKSIEWQAWIAFAIVTLWGDWVIVGDSFFTPKFPTDSYWKIFLIGLLVNLPFLWWLLRFTQQTIEKVSILFVGCLYCLGTGFVWFVFLNGTLDASSTQLHEVAILKKERHSGRGGSQTYSAILENWKQGDQPFEIPLDLPEYNQAFLTGKAKLKTREGFLGVPWLEDFWIKNDE